MDRLIDWVCWFDGFYWLIEVRWSGWLIICLVDCSIEWSLDRLIDCSINDWSIDWLIDYVVLLSFSVCRMMRRWKCGLWRTPRTKTPVISRFLGLLISEFSQYKIVFQELSCSTWINLFALGKRPLPHSEPSSNGYRCWWKYTTTMEHRFERVGNSTLVWLYLNSEGGRCRIGGWIFLLPGCVDARQTDGALYVQFSLPAISTWNSWCFFVFFFFFFSPLLVSFSSLLLFLTVHSKIDDRSWRWLCSWIRMGSNFLSFSTFF